MEELAQLDKVILVVPVVVVAVVPVLLEIPLLPRHLMDMVVLVFNFHQHLEILNHQ
ncbi:MAG: hypothetical protein OXU61_06565 [Gammaproteobacteria bacterium]|nr:hypothetical protein [Gammaproteobacteria bacterium]